MDPLLLLPFMSGRRAVADVELWLPVSLDNDGLVLSMDLSSPERLMSARRALTAEGRGVGEVS